MTLYEFNQQEYANKPDLSAEELEAGQILIENYFNNDSSQYFMCLNNELHHYTVFKHNEDITINFMKFITAISENHIKAIQFDETSGGVEIWMTYQEETVMFLLFDYDWGVII